MRTFTLYPRMGDSNMRFIESQVQSSLPNDFKDFLKANGGLSHYERFFTDTHQITWEVNKYLTFAELHKLLDEFLREYKRKLIPFAYDPGGWHFCLCMDEGKDHGAIIINRWTDHLPKEQFLKIADSFEEFINGLKAEETT